MGTMLNNLEVILDRLDRFIDDANKLDYFKMVDKYYYKKIKEALIDLPTVIYFMNGDYKSLEIDYELGLFQSAIESEKFIRVKRKYIDVMEKYNNGKYEWPLY